MRDVLLLLLLPLLCCSILLLRAAAVLFCGCCCCSRSPPHGVGRPEIYCYALPHHAPPGSPSPTVVPGAASGVHDVLLLLLLLQPLFCRSCYVLLRCSTAINTDAAADVSVCDVFLLLTPVSMVTMQLSMMSLRILKLKDEPICFGSCTSTVSQLI